MKSFGILYAVQDQMEIYEIKFLNATGQSLYFSQILRIN